MVPTELSVAFATTFPPVAASYHFTELPAGAVAVAVNVCTGLVAHCTWSPPELGGNGCACAILKEKRKYTAKHTTAFNTRVTRLLKWLIPEEKGIVGSVSRGCRFNSIFMWLSQYYICCMVNTAS
jgi:hypothetical protein